jgi:hypothetical protein
MSRPDKRVSISITSSRLTLALRFRRRNLYQAPVFQDVLMHFGLDPVHGVRHQPHTLVRVETFHGFHQADIAFLDQIGVREPVAEIATCDRHDQAQVRQHHFLRRIQVIVLLQAPSQRHFFIMRQHRQAVHGRDVCIDIAEIAGEAEFQPAIAGRNQSHIWGCHRHVFFLVEFCAAGSGYVRQRTLRHSLALS